MRFTTRLSRDTGPYHDLFARAAKYSNHFENLRTAGFEIGYTGPLTIEREIPQEPARQKAEIGRAIDLLERLKKQM